MITIQSGKLNIPEEDRFVGFAGDNLSSSKRFVYPDRGNDNGSYTLCLRFDDDAVRVIPLTKSLSDSDLVLTWNIQAKHLLKAGIVMAQIKSVLSGDVILHTSCDYFIVSDSAELSDDGGATYVSRSELEERMTSFLERIRAGAPYIGDDDYWYVYDVEADDFVRCIKAQPDLVIDSSMTESSANPVENRSIKAYVDSALDTKVNKTTRVAGLQLTGNISQADLAWNLSGNINPPMVVQGETRGYGGQFGKTYAGKPMMCMLGTTWTALATESDLVSKMDAAPTVNPPDIDSLSAGQLFTCQGGVALKTESSYIQLAKESNVYSRTYIDQLVGNLEALLSNV